MSQITFFVSLTIAPALLLWTAACSDSSTAPQPQVTSMLVLDGDSQVRFPEVELLKPIKVAAADAEGERVEVAALAVEWEIVSGGGSVEGGAITGDDGTVSATWTLGPDLGQQRLRVQIAGTSPLEVSGYAVAPGPIAFTKYAGATLPLGGIWVVNPDGSDLAQVTSTSGKWPEWNADGTSLIYGRETDDRTTQLFRASAPDWREVQLTSLTAPDPRGLLFMMPSYSPDGSRIVYHLKTSHPDCDGTWTQIMTAEADGKNPIQLTDGCNLAHSRASFSPSGEQVVYRSLEGSKAPGRWSIWVVNADGSSPQRITGDQTHQSDPVWAPDGNRIYYSEADREIWSVRPDGTDSTKVDADLPEFFVLQGISQDGQRLLLDVYADENSARVATLDLATGTLMTVAQNATFAAWRRN